jgi:hypothetical protein
MNFNYIEENITSKYWNTLSRKNISNISNNKFLKKPYVEKYIIELSTLDDNNYISLQIGDLFDSNIITNEDLCLFISNNIDLDNDNKKKTERFFLTADTSDKKYELFFRDVIIYEIKYFRFYQTVTELLFDSKEEDNELYNFILIFIKNKNTEIKSTLKNNIKFQIFHHYIKDLLNTYTNIIKYLKIFNIINNEYNVNEILNLFLKNLFTNWYNIYKKDILENNVKEKIKNYTKKKTLISRILCLRNI